MAKIQPGKASGGGAKPAPRPAPTPAAPAARPAAPTSAPVRAGAGTKTKPTKTTPTPPPSRLPYAGYGRYDSDGRARPQGPTPTPGDTTDTEYDPDRFMREYYARLDAQEKRNATETVKGLLEQYGLSSLYNTIVDYIQQGYDANTVMVLIRTTPQYKARFPAMEALAKKGRAISEAEYINYETLASGLERRYGLPESMLTGKVTDLLTNEVSMTELNDRVVLASAAAIQAPQDVKNTFSQYYGIGQGGMTAYFLDPDIATPLLEKQYASAQIGTEAARQGIGIDVYGAQNLQSLGITTEEARQGFGQVAAQRELTTGLGETLSQQQLIGANLAGDQQAQQALQRVQGSRVGAFQGGGGFAQGQGAVALGSAAR